MKKRLRKLLAAVGIIAIAVPHVYAASDISYDIQRHVKYKVMIDGDTYQVPDTLQFEDGNYISLDRYKENLAKNPSRTISYSNGNLKYLGGVSLSTIRNEYVPLVTNVGLLDDKVNVKTIEDSFAKYQLLNKRKASKLEYENSLENITDENKIKEYNIRISHYKEDIAKFENINLQSTSKEILATIPYLGERMSIKDEVNLTTEKISTQVNVNYYLYSIIFRDLRLANIEYSVNSGQYKQVPDFDYNTYEYTIKLPDYIDDNAKISTKSTGYMEAILEQNNRREYNTGLSIEDDTIQLNNGIGVAKIKHKFNMQDSNGNFIDSNYSSNPERTYTIFFTKYDFVKGDLDKNGYITANDAAVALDIYKNNNATEDDIKIGDLDGNNIINAQDAAMILDMYKNGQ